MTSKRIQKFAVCVVLLSFSAVCILRPELSYFVPTSTPITSLSTVTGKFSTPQIVPMTEENNPTLFRDTFCDFQGLSTPPTEWQLRTPFFLLGGAKKSATTSLSRYLAQHSQLQMARRKELLFFNPKHFEKHGIHNTTGKVLVKSARESMFVRDYNATLMQENPSLLAFEATPGYIFQSTRSPRYILCTVPWVKMVFILRNPVDRVWSNYNFYLSKGINLPSFETWVQRDMALLKRMGMLPENPHSSDFVGSDQEYNAWDLYLQRCNEGPVGRSMYVVQLLHWYQAFRAIGRDPSQNILVVRNEDLKRHPQETLHRIHKWLGVPLEDFEPEAREFMVSQYKVGELSNTTRTMLEDFYRPYNQRLYDLLGGDWQDVWERPANETTNESSYHYRNTTHVVGGRGDKKNKQQKGGSTTQQQQARTEGPKYKVQTQQNSWYTNQANAPTLETIPEDTYVYGKPSYNTATGTDFVNRWCDLEGVDWYPSLNQDAWQLRAPYVLLPGAKKSGTTSLALYLMQHSKVARARTKELQFFMNKRFRAKYVRNGDRKTLVQPARLEYEKEFAKSRLQNDTSLISMDASPGYLFFSSMLPQRILCVSPWVKLLIILRNPVDRAYSNYQYVVWRSKGKFKKSFEQFIEFDIRALRQAGILGNEGNEPFTPEQEDNAWYKYHGLAREGVIGRSLYVIQLRQWFRAIKEVGRDPDTQIHIVRTEDMKNDLNGEYRKVQEFLGLEHEPVRSPEPKVVNKYEPMKNETRTMLEKLFEPFNKRLYEMLGGDWDGYWDR